MAKPGLRRATIFFLEMFDQGIEKVLSREEHVGVRRVLAGAYSPSAGRLRLKKTVRT